MLNLQVAVYRHGVRASKCGDANQGRAPRTTSGKCFQIGVDFGSFRGFSAVFLDMAKINSVQTRCIGEGEAQKIHFSGDFLGAFDFLRVACSLGIPHENS